MQEPVHVVIKVRGGAVTDIVADQPGVSVLVIDYDDAVADAPQARFPLSAAPGAPELPAEFRFSEPVVDAAHERSIVATAECFASFQAGGTAMAQESQELAA